MSMLPGKMEQALSLAVATLAAGVMPAPMERDADRDVALRKLASVAGERGWSMATLRSVAGADADLLFPAGVVEMVEAWSDLCDRAMVDAMQDTQEPRLSQRVRQAILLRLPPDEQRRTAALRGMRVFLSCGGQKAFRRAWLRTVNAIWQAAQDDATGLTYVSKRLTLGGLYASVFLFWLSRGQDEAAFEAFVDRRLADVLRIGRLKARFGVQAGTPAPAAG
ncbi:MAG: rpsU-divergently transcribed protein [Acetobacter fabarum]|jgi:ubiquinone biosynthesis protein COQ9|nr:rpsU-divergently transcribed protein [Acetobacter fabarum]MCI1909132.1 rpsU-divergently transcribed protein [Acetobacter fabarum]MCI1927977.1 rpsU-divergently transcribed protein [Acetobacter fabarum]MCI1947994.1 rpsU-divergently transcribed protein [Acetobacter fabarum]MCI1988985.1 rpsU-divergently transcribed protein [Acetobacter fabarum]